MRYTNTEHTMIRAEVDGKVLLIPANPANRHYRELVLDTGAAVDPYVEPPAPPHEVRKLTIRRRLRAVGKEAAGDAALAAADSQVRADWADAIAISSDDANAIALIQAVGEDPAVILAPE